MNKVFDLTRFGRYFAYDLNRAMLNSGISALIIGLSPIMIYILGIFFYLLGANLMPTSKLTLVLLPSVVAVYVLFFPSKLYGEITDRRTGSNFLMIPASTCEKFISLLLIVLVVLPISITALFIASDLLLSIIPSYGINLFERLSQAELSAHFIKDEFVFSNWTLSANIIEQSINYILFFTLGALVFKRRKTGKTILSYILIVTALVLILSAIASILGHTSFSFEFDSQFSLFWLFSHIINISIAVLLGFFIFRRLKRMEF